MNESAADPLSALEADLGYRFVQRDLLEQALTHASLAAPRRRVDNVTVSYQRLEFLGDRVLGLIIAELLLRQFPNDTEGDLSRRYTDLVRQETLAAIGATLRLGEFVRLPLIEERAARSNPALIADLCEAIIAAIFLDGGLPAAQAFVTSRWGSLIEAQTVAPKDPKTALQEWAQARATMLPRYRVVGTEGPPHRPSFTVLVEVNGNRTASGMGSSKRLAEIAAARALLASLDAEGLDAESLGAKGKSR